MEVDPITGELPIRVGVFLGMLVLMVSWEIFAPRRSQRDSRRIRWPNNLGIVVLNTLFVRLIFPTTAVGLAWFAEQQSWGLLPYSSLPFWASLTMSVILMDLTLYLQHVLFHAVPFLWRLHRMHHADIFFDVTTGVRFHPLEILVSMAIKLTVIAALGPPAIAVLAFEVLLNATSLFNHGNVRINPGADRWLRWILVTPDMHRIHHSVLVQETNSNFGFNLPWWDRLFGTYRAYPSEGHEKMTIGIKQFRQLKESRLDRMLLQPFVKGTGDYPIFRRDEPG